MKKVLTLVLVLAVAQLATAAVWWDVTSVGGGASSGDFTVSLMADENVQDVSIAQLSSDGTPFSVSPLQDPSVWVGSFGGTKQGFYDLSDFGSSGYGAALGTNTTPGEFATGTLVTFTVMGDVGDMIYIDGLPSLSTDAYVRTQAGGKQDFADFGAESFELVPEPMTMALLGLGGLFVRRRRA